jgi:5'-nucleotidase
MQALIEMLSPVGDLFVVAPDRARSGASHSLTVEQPVKIKPVEKNDALTVYACSGTPADCVKLAVNCLLTHKPALVASGINHGSNSSVSVIYSGTMGAAREAAMLGIPAIGFSLCDHRDDADFTAAIHYGRLVAQKTLEQGLPADIALNVNVPALPCNEIRGVKICRQNSGFWEENFERQTDPDTGEEYFVLSGYYVNREPGAKDSDETALANGFISIVPTFFDMTAYNCLDKMADFTNIVKKK